MRKIGSKIISLRQYRLFDLFCFAAILAVFDLLSYFAPKMFGGAATFAFTLTVPITLLIMMRWGWQSVFFAVGDGLLLSLLYNRTVWQSYVIYSVGFSFIMLLLLMTKFFGKQKIAGKWYFTTIFFVLGWVAINLGVTVVQAIFGYNFLQMLGVNFGMNGTGLLSLGIGLVVILVMRRLDGMFEDQKHYLKRKEEERKDMERRDTFGDEPIELDEETLAIFKKDGKDE